MHILFLSHYFPPEVNAPASRTFDHGREWCRHGDRVTWSPARPIIPAARYTPGYSNRLWQRSEMDGVEVIRLWTYLASNQGVVRRTLSYASFLMAIALAAPFLPRPDVVVSTSPQLFCGLAGYLVSRAKRTPWVLEIRDLWPEAIRAVGAIRNRLVIRTLEFLETWSYRKADRVVTVARAFRDHIEARGAGPGTVAVITNGVDRDLFQAPRRDPGLEAELGVSGKFVVGYFGTLGMAHRLETLIEAARLLRDEPEIAFVIVGDGAERTRLERLWNAHGLDNVIMLGQQPKERMPGLWGLCDAAVAHMRKSLLFTTMIRAKCSRPWPWSGRSSWASRGRAGRSWKRPAAAWASSRRTPTRSPPPCVASPPIRRSPGRWDRAAGISCASAMIAGSSRSASPTCCTA
jgi:glycosyltransferase involved in cell wall biosynthesis